MNKLFNNSTMNKQDVIKNQGPTCVLKVSIHCDGCKNKVRKILKKIDGVYKISIDVEQGKVTVTGNVDPAVLIRKLEKSGKHAELWGSQKNSNNYSNNNNTQFDTLNTHFKNLQMSKGEKKNGGDQQAVYPQSLQQMKGMKDSKMPFNMKEQRAVTIELPKKGGDDYDDFSGEDFDEEDDFDDEELGDSDEEFGYGGMKAAGKEKGGGGGKAKKGGGGGFASMIGKAMGGKGEGKTGNEGKKGGGGGPKDGAWEGKSGNKGDVKAISGGSGGKKGGGFPDFEVSGNHKGGAGGGMKGGGFSDFEVTNHRKGGGRGGGGGGRGGMDQMGQFQQLPAGHGRPPAAAMMNMNGGGGGGGFNPGMGQQMQGNPYQQQQYMAMMNRQRMMAGGGGGGDMQHPAMYGRPPPGYGYAAPMGMPPPVYHDPLTHMFSDENTESCSVM